MVKQLAFTQMKSCIIHSCFRTGYAEHIISVLLNKFKVGSFENIDETIEFHLLSHSIKLYGT